MLCEWDQLETFSMLREFGKCLFLKKSVRKGCMFGGGGRLYKDSWLTFVLVFVYSKIS